MTDYIPELANRDPRFGKITIRNLLMIQSGLKYSESFLPLVHLEAPWHDEDMIIVHRAIRWPIIMKTSMACGRSDQIGRI
jgi:CubicO group peptidase (beta-lactamase class C family)